MAGTFRSRPTSSVSGDIPAGGFACGSYMDGHNVHYIPAMKLSRDRVPVDATLSWTGERLELTVGHDVAVVQHHNPAGIRALLAEGGEVCIWYPDLRLACWVTDEGKKWVSLAVTDLADCVSVERARAEEEKLWS